MRGSSSARPNKHKQSRNENTRLQRSPTASEERYESATKANAEDERELEELDARESELNRTQPRRLNDEASSQLSKTRKTLDEAVAARTRTRQMAVDAERQADQAEEAVTKPTRVRTATLRSGKE